MFWAWFCWALERATWACWDSFWMKPVGTGGLLIAATEEVVVTEVRWGEAWRRAELRRVRLLLS